MSTATMPDLSGQQLGPYRLEKKLGQGGMAAVYLSHQEGLMGRPVAVKVLAGMQADDPAYVERFKREVELAAHLEHPHILPVYDFGVQGAYSYLAMRLAEGGTLQERAGRLSQDYPAMLDILGKIAGALDYAHSQGVIHRDIKASNVLFDKTGNPYLADFGIAKIISDPQVSQLTGTNQLLGTPNYMSPEQWRGDNLDGRTDVYSFAVMSYHLLSGHFPFEGPTPFVVMHKHLYELPPELPNLSPLANQVLARALAKAAEDRYASLGAFMEALRAALSGPPEARTYTIDDPTLSTPPAYANTTSGRTATLVPDDDSGEATQIDTPRLPRSRRGLALAALALLILLGLGTGALLLSGGDTPERVEEPTATAALTSPRLIEVCGTKQALELCQYDVYADGSRNLSSRHFLYFDGQIFSPVSWAPDGRHLVFSFLASDADTTRYRTLYTFDTNTNTVEGLYKTGNDTYAVWWPGGDWIAYHSSCSLGMQKSVVDVPPSFEAFEAKFILWEAQAPACINYLAWSPGGQYLAVWATTTTNQKEVWAFTFNPNSPADSPYKVLYQNTGDNLSLVWTPGSELLVGEEGVWRSIPESCWLSPDPCEQADLSLYTDPIRDSWWPNYYPQWGG